MTERKIPITDNATHRQSLFGRDAFTYRKYIAAQCLEKMEGQSLALIVFHLNWSLVIVSEAVNAMVGGVNFKIEM